MTPAQELFHKISGETPDAKEGKMFGALCIKAPNGKAAVIFKDDTMIFKLDGASAKEAMSLDGAKIFAPMEDRPMNGWIQLSYDYSDKWKGFAEHAMTFVKALKK